MKFEKKKYGGFFLVFEGLDGSGKSTQAEMLFNKFHNAILLHEPTEETKEGRRIRSILIGKSRPVSPLKMQMLFAEDRRAHLENIIIPALRAGKIVICDRYIFSSMAYRGVEVAMEEIVSLNEGFLYPDATIFLRVLPGEGVRRMCSAKKEVDLFEKEEFLAGVAVNYERLLVNYPDVYAFNGEQSLEQVHQEITEFLRRILWLKKKMA